MDAEMQALHENNTWELVNYPEGRNMVDNIWVYKIKLHTDGTVDKFKARLVAKGFTQLAGVDHVDTFSPLARFDTIRSVISVVVAERLHLMQFDVKTAFLYGGAGRDNLDETADGLRRWDRSSL